MTRIRWCVAVFGIFTLGGIGGCDPGKPAFDPKQPAMGPGGLVGGKKLVTDGAFAGEGTEDPAPLADVPPPQEEVPACDSACRAYCDGLALENPVDAAVCPVMWGVGLDTLAIDETQVCRRLYADLLGRFPTLAEVDSTCRGRSPGELARSLMSNPLFVEVNQRRWADLFLYNNEAVSIERIWDMDRLVGKLYRGEIPYDQFVAAASAHPVLVRRHATPGDRAEALFHLFLGRPPFENERSDMGRLYSLWENGYYDHPTLAMRLPDAVLRYRCVDQQGNPDPLTKGECTSVLWGYNELILKPDIRAREGRMWSGLLRASEWQALQAPGRLLARQQQGVWEHAASEVLRHYLGYDLGVQVPAVRERLVQYVLRYSGDMRALHHAVVTSQVYLQANAGTSATAHRWTYGPQKQVEVETWIDTIKHATGYKMSQCDHRMPQPEQFLQNGSISATAVVQASKWELSERGVNEDYASLARTLGGCPENVVGGRFKTISILTTATQQSFVTNVCNPALDDKQPGAAIARLLPNGVEAKRALDAELGASIFSHQVGLFFGREASSEEIEHAKAAADACVPKVCTAEAFARPVCYALLSSSELLFY